MVPRKRKQSCWEHRRADAKIAQAVQQGRFLILYSLILLLASWSCKTSKESLDLSKKNLIGSHTIKKIRSSQALTITNVGGARVWKIDENFSDASLLVTNPDQYALILDIRFDPYCGEEHYLFNTAKNDSYLFLELGKLNYRTSHRSGRDEGSIKLDGTGARSYANLFDGKFHRIAVAWIGKERRKVICIDGQIVLDTKKSAEKLTSMLHSGSETFRFFKLGGKQSTRAMSLKSVYILEELHEIESFLKHQTKLDSKSGTRNLDPREYPTAYGALQQLKRFPLPAYPQNHESLRLYNWMGLDYLGSERHGVPKATAVQRSVEIQKELATRWNYYLSLGNTKLAKSRKIEDPYLKAWINLANRHPELPLSATSLWAQVDHRVMNEGEALPYITRSTLPKREYLSNGHLSPWSKPQWAKKDGAIQKLYFNNLLGNLQRPIDIINENGEVPPKVFKDGELRSETSIPESVRALSKQALFDEQSERKLALRKAYANAFLSLPELEQTKFSWYNVAGGPIDAYNWDIASRVMTLFDGKRLSTPSFYPRSPDNWRYWKGPWHGWEWIVSCRKTELEYGDAFYSPFISPGWSIRPEENIRPSQWLALLKSLSATGALSFYTGFFNVGESVHARPEEYIWQAAMPSYAQATFSKLFAFMENSHFLQDEEGAAIITYPNKRPDVLLIIRKHNDGEKYLICSSIMPMGNAYKNCPDQVMTSFVLSGKEYSVSCRKQGSVYTLDLGDLSKPVMIQHDSGHGIGHPSNWKRCSQEAEELSHSRMPTSVFEDPTVSTLWPFTTSVQYNSPSKEGFDTGLRAGSKLEQIQIYYRSENESVLSLEFQGKRTHIELPSSPEFRMYQIPIQAKVDSDNPRLSFNLLSGSFHLDKFILEY